VPCDRPPAVGAAFRFTVTGRTLVLNVTSQNHFGPDSITFMARSLRLPLDADVNQLVVSFHEGIAKVHIVRKADSTLVPARTTEEMMVMIRWKRDVYLV